NAGVTLTTKSNGPVHGLSVTDRRLPICADLAQIVREDERRARSVRSVSDVDSAVRKSCSGIESADLLIVPIRNLAEKDVGNEWAGEVQSRSQARNVVGDALRADHDGNVKNWSAGGRHLGRIHGRVASREVNRLVDERGNATARADGLIVNADS